MCTHFVHTLKINFKLDVTVVNTDWNTWSETKKLVDYTAFKKNKTLNFSHIFSKYRPVFEIHNVCGIFDMNTVLCLYMRMPVLLIFSFNYLHCRWNRQACSWYSRGLKIQPPSSSANWLGHDVCNWRVFVIIICWDIYNAYFY